MSDATQITLALIGSASTIILSFGTLIGTLRNTNKHNEGLAKQDKQMAKQDEIAAQNTVIQNQTNGTLTALRAELTAALTRIDTQQQAISVLQQVLTLKDKEKISKQKESLEGTIMKVMQENADTREELIKAKVSPAVDPKEL